MPKLFPTLLRYFAVSGFLTLTLFAQAPDPFDVQILEELTALNPAAPEVFQQANAARAADDFAQAEALYRQVLELAPNFFHAKRRLCGVVVSQGRRSEAIDLCRQAAAEEPGLSYNQLSLIRALLAGTDDDVTDDEAQEVAMRAKRIVDDSDLDPDYLPLLAEAASVGDDLELLGAAVARMRLEAPDNASTHYYDWLDAISRGELFRAREAIKRAAQAGLSEETLAWMATTINEEESIFAKAWPYAWKIALAWFGVLCVLLIAGAALSRATLRASERVPEIQSGQALGIDSNLRNSYTAVLWMASAFYYLSLPLILLTVGAAGAGVLYGMLALGRIPIKIALVVLAVCGVTFWATLKSLFVRPDEEDPGEKLDLPRHSELKNVLDEVAGQIGTRPVDNVYLTPGTDLAVMERGGFGRRVRGNEERCLILGVGVLEGMDLGMFKAILGHEYGHFSNRDTAGGGLALSARRSLGAMAQALAEGGAATWYNPAWLFLNGFFLIYQRISQGASRLQELLADRWATFAYGAKFFERGLRHVIERSIRFDAQANAAFSEHAYDRRALVNVYQFTPKEAIEESDVADAVEQTIAAEPSAYDSHPAPVDRFRWVHALEAAPSGDLSTAKRPVWSLFPNRSELEEAMTGQLRLRVATMEAYAEQAAADAA